MSEVISLQTALQELNLQKQDSRHFDEAEFLSRPPYLVEIPIWGIENKVVRRPVIEVSRQTVLEIRNELYRQWQEEGLVDRRGVLKRAVGIAFRIATEEYNRIPRNKKTVQIQPKEAKPKYVVNPL